MVFVTKKPENVYVKKAMAVNVATSASQNIMVIPIVNRVTVVPLDQHRQLAIHLENVAVCIISLGKHANNAVPDITNILNV